MIRIRTYPCIVEDKPASGSTGSLIFRLFMIRRSHSTVVKTTQTMLSTFLVSLLLSVPIFSNFYASRFVWIFPLFYFSLPFSHACRRLLVSLLSSFVLSSLPSRCRLRLRPPPPVPLALSPLSSLRGAEGSREGERFF